jgi:hypothetical protein
MLLFRSEEHIDRWCAARDLPRGGTMTPEQCRRLAHAWYADKLAREWHRKTLDEAEAVFAEIGLTGPFWRLRG